jgi:ankyrin repeat protein
MPTALPPRPNLEQYKKQAKDLLKRWRAGDADARHRIALHHPRLARAGSANDIALADVQFALAREHGFAGWTTFAAEIERRTAEQDGTARIWREAERALMAGEADALESIMRAHLPLFRTRRPPPFGPEPGRLSPSYAGKDVRQIIADNHHFATWDEYVRWRADVDTPGSSVARFEAAADAIADGNAEALAGLLGADPDLVRARSARSHQSTLLHYVGANGIEAYRQKTPPNAVVITRLLLDAGADVHAEAGMYGGGSTTLGLVATSIHPQLAGVQDDLMALLLEHGTVIDDPKAGGNDSSAIAGCLANARPQAAEFLARRGARVNLATAAGVGRLDVVRQYFDDGGALTRGATTEQLHQGFVWAAYYRRRALVAFLLERGVDPGVRVRGSTALHWAAFGGHVDVVEILIAAGAPVDATDDHHAGTPLGWAVYGWGSRPDARRREPYYAVVATLARAGGTVAPDWLREEDRGYPLDDLILADPRMTVALGGVA